MTAPVGLPRLLHGVHADGTPVPLAEHERVHGPLPRLPAAELVERVELTGLRGRGGADFPTAVKLRAVASRRGASALVVNGSETEPASQKDLTLLATVPHLVLDGAVLAARAVGAPEVIVKLDQHSGEAIPTVRGAVAARPESDLHFSLVVGEDGYVTGEESAVVNLLNHGTAKPTFVPPRPFERGYRNRPTLIQNVETLAQLALVARHGPDWYRELGTPADPGSVLVTISGAVNAPGVYELAFGTPMAQLLAAAGGPSQELQAILVGGYFGNWIPLAAARPLKLAREQLRAAGAALGAGVIIALPQTACGLHESARIADYLARQSAGQCGPCVHGLRDIADGMIMLARGHAPAGTLDRVRRWCQEVKGRGACHHPGGAAGFVESSLRAFSHELSAHRGGRCDRRPVGLPLGHGVDPLGADPRPVSRGRRGARA
jgi:NADH:ubiquinone oxidoreductase subunit F (NADH-binding)